MHVQISDRDLQSWGNYNQIFVLLVVVSNFAPDCVRVLFANFEAIWMKTFHPCLGVCDIDLKVSNVRKKLLTKTSFPQDAT